MIVIVWMQFILEGNIEKGSGTAGTQRHKMIRPPAEEACIYPRTEE